MMKFFSNLVFLLGLSSFVTKTIPLVAGCTMKVTVKNNYVDAVTGEPVRIRVYWRGHGDNCVMSDGNWGYICRWRTLEFGESFTHAYKWGTIRERVTVKGLNDSVGQFLINDHDETFSGFQDFYFRNKKFHPFCDDDGDKGASSMECGSRRTIVIERDSFLDADEVCSRDSLLQNYVYHEQLSQYGEVEKLHELVMEATKDQLEDEIDIEDQLEDPFGTIRGAIPNPIDFP